MLAAPWLIEPKVVFGDGAVGTEDTWVATKDGLKCLTGGTGLPSHGVSDLNSKTKKNAMREAFRLLSERTDPHGFPIKSEDILKSIVITNEGDISLKIRPKIPHCPCCLYDLSLLKRSFYRMTRSSQST